MTKPIEFSIRRTGLAGLAAAAFAFATLAAGGASAAPVTKVSAAGLSGAKSVLFARKTKISRKKKKTIITPIPVDMHEGDCH